MDASRPSPAGRKSWGLVLSGGAACGLANIGVLEVLHEARLRPDCIAGSSMGAIIAALYALGHCPGAIRQLASRLAPASIVRLSEHPLRAGLHGGVLRQQLERHLAPLVGDARIGECSIPFVCVAGRVSAPIRWQRLLHRDFLAHLRDRVQVHVFPPQTRVLDAVRASSAIPVVFSPVRIGDEEFVDLVHFGAIPARSLRRMYAPQRVIATDTQPRYDAIEPWLPSPLRRFLAAGRMETQASIDACDLIIRPELPASMLRFDCSEAFADAGRAAASRCLEALRAQIGAMQGPASGA